MVKRIPISEITLPSADPLTTTTTNATIEIAIVPTQKVKKSLLTEKSASAELYL